MVWFFRFKKLFFSRWKLFSQQLAILDQYEIIQTTYYFKANVLPGNQKIIVKIQPNEHLILNHSFFPAEHQNLLLSIPQELITLSLPTPHLNNSNIKSVKYLYN